MSSQIISRRLDKAARLYDFFLSPGFSDEHSMRFSGLRIVIS